MAMKWLLIVLGTLLVLAAPVCATEFDRARAAIDEARPNISYEEFCVDIRSGEDKIACRIRSVPAVGFLVCKYISFEGISCSQVIMTELDNIIQVAMNGVRTVTVNPPLINGVMCGEDTNTDCSGFLEEWVTNGEFQQIRDHIVNGTVEQLISQIEAFTDESGWATTANNLFAIAMYMVVNKDEDQYRQICDLQGFFLKSGGFLVADVPQIENTGLNNRCYEGEPTTQQVFTALDMVIKALVSTTLKYSATIVPGEDGQGCPPDDVQEAVRANITQDIRKRLQVNMLLGL